MAPLDADGAAARLALAIKLGPALALALAAGRTVQPELGAKWLMCSLGEVQGRGVGASGRRGGELEGSNIPARFV